MLCLPLSCLCLESLTEVDGPASAVPQRAGTGIDSPLLADNPFAAKGTVLNIPNLLLQPRVDLVNGINPGAPLLRSLVVLLAKVATQGNVCAGYLVARGDLNASRLCQVKDVATQVVVGVGVAADDAVFLERQGGGRGGLGLAGGWDEGDGKGGQIVGDHGLDQAGAVGVGEAGDVGDGGTGAGDEGVDLLGGLGVGDLEGGHVHAVLGHEPDCCMCQWDVGKRERRDSYKARPS